MNSSIVGLKLVQPQSIITRKLLLWMSIISILAATCNVIADFILTYDPQGNYSPATPAPLTIELWRVLAGSSLGVFCIPFELATGSSAPSWQRLHRVSFGSCFG